jgi:hypothetical protein
MSWTKRAYITEAMTELGLADYVYDLTPAELQSALRRLDTMMSEWEGRGIRVGYPMAGTPGASDIDAETSVPEVASTAIITNLARQLAPSFGKQVAQETMMTARKSLSTLSNTTTSIPEMQFPASLPRGAGQKSWRGGYQNPFFPRPSSPVAAGPDSDIDFE